jgi:hypothetical protein
LEACPVIEPFPDDAIVLPSEVSVPSTGGSNLWPLPEPDRSLVPWNTAKENFGGLLVMDEHSPTLVSVLCTVEPVNLWVQELASFPSPDETDPGEQQVELTERINVEIERSSLYRSLDENGRPQSNWRCRDLLQAMYLMLHLDTTGANEIRKCQSRGCPEYFRIGSQSKTLYCSPRCANRASTRKGRGQEP